MDFESMTVSEIEAYLDENRGSKPRDVLLQAMAARNQKIKQAEYDHWGLSEEQYLAACAEAEHSGQPVHVALNRARSRLLKEARKAQSATAGAVNVGVEGRMS